MGRELIRAIIYQRRECDRVVPKFQFGKHSRAMLFEVVEQGQQTAFVCEIEAGLADLYPLLTQAAAITNRVNICFSEALPQAAAERGIPLRRIWNDEAEALRRDLGYGGDAEQRIAIDLDDGRIQVEYDHRADSLREILDALANSFSMTFSGNLQNRLVAYLAEHDGSEALYQTLRQELGLSNQELEEMGFHLQHRYETEFSGLEQGPEMI